MQRQSIYKLQIGRDLEAVADIYHPSPHLKGFNFDAAQISSLLHMNLQVFGFLDCYLFLRL
jgi:hypothetical protein